MKEARILDQERIEKFITHCRKEQKLTQEQLTEKLGITYKSLEKENIKYEKDKVDFELDI